MNDFLPTLSFHVLATITSTKSSRDISGLDVSFYMFLYHKCSL